MRLSYDIAIVGAGAAGLTAAIFARRAAPSARIVALDGAPKIGAKILISGGGRCNVTHHAVAAADFNGNRNAINKVLRTFTIEETVEWFREMGVTLKREETGKLFPTTDKARTVVDALLRAAEGVEILAKHRVVTCHPERSAAESRDPLRVHHPPHDGRGSLDFARDDTGFTLRMMDGREIEAQRVILATGGRSVPKTGSDGHGYVLARALGHTTTEVFPALVPLLLEEGHWLTTLSGTSTEAELSVRGGTGRVLARVRGSLLFTHFGLSGPCALDVSRHWIAAKREDPRVTLTASFLPDETFESLDKALQTNTVNAVLRGRIPARLLEALESGRRTADGGRWDDDGADSATSTVRRVPSAVRPLSKEARRAFVRDVLELPLPVIRDRGFDYAEVTAGGVPLSEVDLATMASRKCENLFLCGEILDVDGRIGGFNFQWAWASGRLAGLNAARSLHKSRS